MEDNAAVWRIGSTWGKSRGEGNSLLNIFKNHRIAFGGNTYDPGSVSIGNLVVITAGRTVTAIGIVAGKKKLDEIKIARTDCGNEFTLADLHREVANRPVLVLDPLHWLENTDRFPCGGTVGRGWNQVKNEAQRKRVINTFNRRQSMLFTDELRQLLASAKQVVLTGAPGTGKTYTAKTIAEKAINTSVPGSQVDEKKIRMAFVQFHPSFDYTDFVEGLKPVINAGTITFELRNGVFKEFCRRAGVIERICFEELVGRDIEHRALTLDDVKSFDATKLRLHLNESTDGDVIKFWEAWLAKAKETKDEPKNIELPEFYFIIDEINRADLSRVFGELFYALEPSYRGVKGAVTTQYASLNTGKTYFVRENNDKFFVPSNVYVIGTMNDIDRSVESFDFALRRRFAWMEIMADMECFENVTADLKSKSFYSEARQRYESLNQAIGKDPQLGNPYKIGPAYFRNLEKYEDKGQFDKLWDNHLKLLIKEYLRGMPKADRLLEEMHVAYVNRVTVSTHAMDQQTAT